ncbi:ABC transporter ATP-binding protein [Algibacter lectus]|uniref:Putative iron-uptake ABC transport system ATP-binding protein n=1 Tax=Algibacter lectus TaxID=221126 RepID=A0A090WSV6_9FLAO|nr:ABC transporter ATP-binding protein [Algibacter lectus]MDO7137261.1 ABC transporter ATP-binding protein [Algibacter lectus]GAL78444.1 putative iron-uptake ABC transport system ATP-binding protein [Algibacter lectus]
MLQVNTISFSYQKTEILKNISFSVKAGEQLSIIGESGSGKSTLLKLLYGEFDLNSGRLFWRDTEILGPKYNLVVGYDFMKYVAQEFDLMPFTSVSENIGAFLSNFYPEEKQERIKELLEVVELTAFAKVKVKTLSGGQKQRVALARALAKEPEIMLLDEPFSHIDNFKKQSLRRNVFKYLKLKNIACVVATHDKEDVLGFADRMLILNNHEVEEEGSPEDLFKNPKTPLIASFFGEFNVIDNKIIYAHQLEVVEDSSLKVRVKQTYFKGHYYLIGADLNGELVFFEHKKPLDVDTEVCLVIN